MVSLGDPSSFSPIFPTLQENACPLPSWIVPNSGLLDQVSERLQHRSRILFQEFIQYEVNECPTNVQITLEVAGQLHPKIVCLMMGILLILPKLCLERLGAPHSP